MTDRITVCEHCGKETKTWWPDSWEAERDTLRARVRNLEDKVGGQKSVVNTAGLIMAQTKSGDAGELLDKYNALREAVRKVIDISDNAGPGSQCSECGQPVAPMLDNAVQCLEYTLTEGGGEGQQNRALPIICSKSGNDRPALETCGVCYGAGVVPETVHDEDGNPIHGANICPNCKGTKKEPKE